MSEGPSGVWAADGFVTDEELAAFSEQMASPRALELIASLQANPGVETIAIEHAGVTWRWQPRAEVVTE